MLGFFFDGTDTHQQPAARASVAVLFRDSCCEVDVSHVCDGCQPSEHVREFFFEVIPVSPCLEGRSEFTDFFHEPHESTRDAPLKILFVVHAMDQLLKVFDADLRMSVAGRRLILVGAGLHSGSEARVLKVAEKVKSLVRIPNVRMMAVRPVRTEYQAVGALAREFNEWSGEPFSIFFDNQSVAIFLAVRVSLPFANKGY